MRFKAKEKLVAKVALRFYFCKTSIAEVALQLKNGIAEVAQRFIQLKNWIAKVALRFDLFKNQIALVALRCIAFKKFCAFLRCASVYSEKMPTSAKNTSLLMLHMNIVSLQKKFDSLYKITSQLWNAPHIICLSESRLKTSTGITTNISLPGYKFLHYNTPTNDGGSAIYSTLMSR